jgi:Uma2 family endonuclease
MSETTISDVTIEETTTAVEPDAPPRLPMSYEEFIAWADEDTRAEWVDGEVIPFMPPKTIHQTLAGFLYRLIATYVDLFKLGSVHIAPLEMRITWGDEKHSARQPDVFFVAQEHSERLTADRLDGPADLAIEVISPDSVARDRADKFYEYQEAGVREYIIIDPRPGKQRLDWYVLLPEGKYQAVLPDEQGRYHAHVLPGFWLREAWLWPTPPDPLAALLEIPEATQALRHSLGGMAHD